MCCSIRTVDRAMRYLRQNEYILVEYQRRQVALIRPNYAKIEQIVNEMADKKCAKNLDLPNVDKSVDKPVDKSILDPPFCRIKTPPISQTIKTNFVESLGSTIGESRQPFLHTKLPNSRDSHPSRYTKIDQTPTAIQLKQSIPYACSTLYKNVAPRSYKSEIDVIANIIKFYNECTESKLSYNTGAAILRSHVEKGLTLEIGMIMIRDRMFKFKQKECDERDTRLKRIFN